MVNILSSTAYYIFVKISLLNTILAMNVQTPITTQATNNQTVTIPDKSHFTVLYFYPKDATPGCTKEGLDFSALNSEFTKSNTVVYGVSRDSLKSHENFKAKQGFVFELISDSDESLCHHFGVIQLKKNYGKEYMGVVRSTFVLSPEGEVLKHWNKVKVAGHAQAVLDFVQTLQ